MSKYSVDKWIIEWEIIQAQFPGDHDKHVHWVLSNSEIPEANKNAILKRYGYEPQQIDSGMDTVKRKPGRPRNKEL